jgi:hypothetical protein
MVVQRWKVEMKASGQVTSAFLITGRRLLPVRRSLTVGAAPGPGRVRQRRRARLGRAAARPRTRRAAVTVRVMTCQHGSVRILQLELASVTDRHSARLLTEPGCQLSPWHLQCLP